MKLFLPSARATNWLLIVGFCSLGYALYIRYLWIEQSSVDLACAGGLDTWLCLTRHIVYVLYSHSVFGWAAFVIAALNLLRRSLVVFAVALSFTSIGIVLYDINLSALAAGLLLLCFARREFAPD